MINDEDRTFTLGDLVEIVLLVAALGLLFWLLDPLNAWLKIPAVLLGTAVVLIAWRGVRKLLERRSDRRNASEDGPPAAE